jgi:hypothetical protein
VSKPESEIIVDFHHTFEGFIEVKRSVPSDVVTRGKDFVLDYVWGLILFEDPHATSIDLKEAPSSS